VSDDTTNGPEAMKWLREAAEGGDRKAQRELGECYFLGKGVPVDKAKAREWWDRANRRNEYPKESGPMAPLTAKDLDEMTERVAKLVAHRLFPSRSDTRKFDEAGQVARIAVWKARDKVEKEAHNREAYAYTVALNAVLAWRKSEAIQKKRATGELDKYGRRISPDYILSMLEKERDAQRKSTDEERHRDRELKGAVYRELKSLPKLEAAVIRLRYLSDEARSQNNGLLPYKKVAQALGTTKGAVRNAHQRAVNKFRRDEDKWKPYFSGKSKDFPKRALETLWGPNPADERTEE